MISAVKSRPNHYEVLGLKTTASEEEIAQAFARQMRLPHPTAELAQIGVAFDTLRSAVKRRSYDEALGLRSAPPPTAVPAAMSFRISARLAALASPGPIEPPPPVADKLEGRVSAVGAQRRPNGPSDLRSTSSVGQLPPARPSSDAPAPGLIRPIEQRERVRLRAGAAARAQPAIEELLQLRRDAGDERASGWSKNAVALGGLLLTVVLIGAWAGAHAQDSDHAQPQSAIVAAKRHPIVAGSGAALSEKVAAPASAPAPAAVPGKQMSHPTYAARPRSSGVRLAGIDQSLASGPPEAAPVEGTSGQAESESTAASAVGANLPLPKAVIARTIERIGYACGEVASASAAEGGGVYKITCTSGQSYQAKPVHGRYRFKRL